MSTPKNIVILTSSRADYGIYKRLLEEMSKDDYFNLQLIVFGAHVLGSMGASIHQIESDGYPILETVDSLVASDSALGNSTSTGLTAIKFADVWGRHASNIDLVIALGDRFEMYAAVLSSVPFGVPVAHLHGGEVTLGAIDNIYRDCITLASQFHFTSTENYAERVGQLLNDSQNVFNVGSLSLDGIREMEHESIEAFQYKWGIDLRKKTIIATYHPETVNISSTDHDADVWIDLLEELLPNYQIILGPPNADTNGSIIRTKYAERLKNQPNLNIIESLGKLSYFTALKHCSFALGNSSSGIIEVASFGKYALNIGDRQKGRAHSGNVLHAPYNLELMKNQVQFIEGKEYAYTGSNIYEQPQVAKSICDILKTVL